MVFGLTEDEMKKLLIQSLIKGIMWAAMFFFIRKGMNKRNFTGTPEENMMKKESFKWDAIYGGAAAFLSSMLSPFVMNAVL